MLKNVSMLLVQTRTVNFFNIVRVSLHAMANFTKCILMSCYKFQFMAEQAVHDMVNRITEFSCNPFDLSNPAVRSLLSGQLASPNS